MTPSSKIDDEIDRLMRDPNALRSEPSLTPGGRDHYDPTQPRVPAGNSKGGQWTAGGYRGGGSKRDIGGARPSLDATQFAQVGSGSPREAYAQFQPFDGWFGEIDTRESLVSQNIFIQLKRDHDFNPRSPVTGFEAGDDGRFQFFSTRPFHNMPLPNGFRITLTSTTYAHDKSTGAYVTIRATSARPVVIQEIDGVVSIERQ